MRKIWLGILLLGIAGPAHGQDAANWVSDLTKPHNYIQKRISSYDRTGGNADYRPMAVGETLTLLDEAGPGEISHVWITIASDEQYHLKKIVLRMYWDGEATPSVEAPVGDFFGLGLGDYFLYQSIPLSVGADKALNSFFPMPFQKHARITLTNEGHERVDALYWNIDMRAYASAAARGHALFSRAIPPGGAEQSNSERKDESRWREQLCVDGSHRPRPFCRRHDVCARKRGWLVGRGRRHVFCGRRKAAFDQRHRLRGLFSRRVGFRRKRIFLRLIRCAGCGRGAAGSDDGPSIASISIRRFRLRNRCAPQSSMAPQTIVATIFIPSRIGIRRSRTRPSPPCRPSRIAFRT